MTDNTEIKWKWLNEEKKYKVYEDGTVYSEINKKKMKQRTTKLSPKPYIKLLINNKYKRYNYSIVIYETFKEKIDLSYLIINIDGNIKNNHINNLKKIPRNEIKKINDYDKNIWKPIIGYENKYAINNAGEILSLLTGKTLYNNHCKKYTNTYAKHALTDDNGIKTDYYVHRLVYSTFHNIPQKDFGNKVIDHIDRNKHNNNLDNLRLVSISENNKNVDFSKQHRQNDTVILANDFKIISNLIRNYNFSEYEINTYGQVRNINKRKKILLAVDNNKYKQVDLRDKDTRKKKTIYIHTLVASVFIPNPNNYNIVNHIDEQRDNNHVSNLEWCTHRENVVHSIGKKVGQYNLNGTLINTFRCIADAYLAINKNVSNSGIGSACNGRIKTAYGFIWKFLDENNNPIEKKTS